jgi:hypothetical protein
MRLARLGGVVIGLNAVPSGEMGVVGGSIRFFRRKASFGLPVVLCSFLVMMRGIVMVPCGRMRAGHVSPQTFRLPAREKDEIALSTLLIEKTGKRD